MKKTLFAGALLMSGLAAVPGWAQSPYAAGPVADAGIAQQDASRAGSQPARGEAGPVTPALGDAERRAVVETIATVMAARYADAEAGARLAERLRQRLAAGAYDPHSDPGELAAALTADMRDAVQDKHLRAMYEPGRSATPQQGPAVQGMRRDGAPAAVATVDPRSAAQLARANYGFDRLERLAGNVGYLKLSQFVPLAQSEETATTAMAFLADTDAMIIDLRGVPGGSPDLVARLISYFTGPEPVTLMTTYMRAADLREEVRTTADVPGRRMTGRPLVVLIDDRTASSAEMFAYFVQRQGLGTLVGATTSGAGLGGNVVPAGFGVHVFVPQIQITDGPGWERTGIAPDVQVDPGSALDVAHATLLERLADADVDPQAQRERRWALALMRPTTADAAGMPPLSVFEGLYGARRFSVLDGVLAELAPGGARVPLTRVGPNVFRTRSVRLTFDQNGDRPAADVLRETIDGASTRIARTAAITD